LGTEKEEDKEEKVSQFNEISLVYICVPLLYRDRQRGSIKASSGVKGKLEFHFAFKINCFPASCMFKNNKVYEYIIPLYLHYNSILILKS
jgi:hypothetical protein